MAVRELVPIECPRGNGGHKEVWIDRDDPNHVRECSTCAYTWGYRQGMPTYPGESFEEPGAKAEVAAEEAGETEERPVRRRK